MNKSEKECVSESFSVPVQGAINNQVSRDKRGMTGPLVVQQGGKKLKVHPGEGRWRIGDSFHQGGAGLQEDNQL